MQPDHHPFEHLDAFLATLDDPDVDAHRVSNLDLGAALAAPVE